MAEEVSKKHYKDCRKASLLASSRSASLEESLETEKDILEQQRIQLEIEKEQLEILKLQERLGKDVAEDISDQIDSFRKAHQRV